jgi:hypothetical protein
MLFNQCFSSQPNANKYCLNRQIQNCCVTLSSASCLQTVSLQSWHDGQTVLCIDNADIFVIIIQRIVLIGDNKLIPGTIRPEPLLFVLLVNLVIRCMLRCQFLIITHQEYLSIKINYKFIYMLVIQCVIKLLNLKRF